MSHHNNIGVAIEERAAKKSCFVKRRAICAGPSSSPAYIAER